MINQAPADWSIPHDHPYYPRLPARYEHLKLQMVFFRANPEALAAFVPEPLVPAADGSCVAGGLTVTACDNYGPFDETWVQLKCALGETNGWFCSHVPHTQPNAIAAGREIYGTPKFFAEIAVNQGGNSMRTTCNVAGEPMMTLSTITDEPCRAAQLPPVSPSWRLKMIPRADGPGVAVKQLIDVSAAVSDVAVHACRRGTGSVKFLPNKACDLSCLAPIEIEAAYFVDTSFTEGYARIVYDYLE